MSCYGGWGNRTESYYVTPQKQVHALLVVTIFRLVTEYLQHDTPLAVAPGLSVLDVVRSTAEALLARCEACCDEAGEEGHMQLVAACRDLLRSYCTVKYQQQDEQQDEQRAAAATAPHAQAGGDANPAAPPALVP